MIDGPKGSGSYEMSTPNVSKVEASNNMLTSSQGPTVRETPTMISTGNFTNPFSQSYQPVSSFANTIERPITGQSIQPISQVPVSPNPFSQSSSPNPFQSSGLKGDIITQSPLGNSPLSAPFIGGSTVSGPSYFGGGSSTPNYNKPIELFARNVGAESPGMQPQLAANVLGNKFFYPRPDYIKTDVTEGTFTRTLLSPDNPSGVQSSILSTEKVKESDTIGEHTYTLIKDDRGYYTKIIETESSIGGPATAVKKSETVAESGKYYNVDEFIKDAESKGFTVNILEGGDKIQLTKPIVNTYSYNNLGTTYEKSDERVVNELSKDPIARLGVFVRPTAAFQFASSTIENVGNKGFGAGASIKSNFDEILKSNIRQSRDDPIGTATKDIILPYATIGTISAGIPVVSSFVAAGVGTLGVGQSTVKVVEGVKEGNRGKVLAGAIEGALSASLLKSSYKGLVTEGSIKQTTTSSGNVEALSRDINKDTFVKSQFREGSEINVKKTYFEDGKNMEVNYKYKLSPEDTIKSQIKPVGEGTPITVVTKTGTYEGTLTNYKAASHGPINAELVSVDVKGTGIWSKTPVPQTTIAKITSQAPKYYNLQSSEVTKAFVFTPNKPVSIEESQMIKDSIINKQGLSIGGGKSIVQIENIKGQTDSIIPTNRAGTLSGMSEGQIVMNPRDSKITQYKSDSALVETTKVKFPEPELRNVVGQNVKVTGYSDLKVGEVGEGFASKSNVRVYKYGESANVENVAYTFKGTGKSNVQTGGSSTITKPTLDTSLDVAVKADNLALEYKPIKVISSSGATNIADVKTNVLSNSLGANVKAAGNVISDSLVSKPTVIQQKPVSYGYILDNKPQEKDYIPKSSSEIIDKLQINEIAREQITSSPRTYKPTSGIGNIVINEISQDSDVFTVTSTKLTPSLITETKQEQITKQTTSTLPYTKLNVSSGVTDIGKVFPSLSGLPNMKSFDGYGVVSRPERGGMKLSGKSKVPTKYLYPDMISATISQARYGKSTAPNFTPSQIEKHGTTFYSRVPTKEMMRYEG